VNAGRAGHWGLPHLSTVKSSWKKSAGTRKSACANPSPWLLWLGPANEPRAEQAWGQHGGSTNLNNQTASDIRLLICCTLRSFTRSWSVLYLRRLKGLYPQEEAAGLSPR
jgi:hypothetical protein